MKMLARFRTQFRIVVIFVAVAAVVAAAVTVYAGTRQEITPPISGTPANSVKAPLLTNDPTLPNISPRVLATMGVILSNPAGRGTATVSATAARRIALPLGEGSGSRGWAIVGNPVLAWMSSRVDTDTVESDLVWAVELHSPGTLPCHGPGVCHNTNHILLEFFDAATGAVVMAMSGGSLP